MIATPRIFLARHVLLLVLLAHSAQHVAGEKSAFPQPRHATAHGDLPEAVYEERFRRRYELKDRSYGPLWRIRGSQTSNPLEHCGDVRRTTSSEVLSAAERYASERNSTALLVWRKGCLELSRYFDDVTPLTLLDSGSLAKPLAVIAVGRAIHEGFIDSLDQPALAFFPEWMGTPKAKIKVRHLLDMRSGLLPQSAELLPMEHVMNRAFLHPYHARIVINEYPLVSSPGSEYGYSNAAFELIAPLIERSTGIAYAEWLDLEVLRPLGAPGGDLWLNRPGGTAHSACCMQLPAQTYLRLALLVMQGGSWNGEPLLSEDFVLQMQSSTSQNLHAAMGVYLGQPYREWRGPLHPGRELGRVFHSEPYAADDLVLFDGNNNQVAYIVPSKELVLLRLGGRPAHDKGWDNAYLPNLVLRGLAHLKEEPPEKHTSK